MGCGHSASDSFEISSDVSSRAAARAESWMLGGREAPGIGITVGASASSQARITCCTDPTILSDALEGRAAGAARGGTPDAAERRPGQERNAELGTVLEFTPT